MSKETKAIILTSAVLASAVTPVYAEASEDKEVKYTDIVTAGYMQEVLGKDYQEKHIATYSNALKTYFEEDKNIKEVDVKNVLTVVNGYINLKDGKNTTLDTKSTVVSINNDLEVLNYIEGMLKTLKEDKTKDSILSDIVKNQKDITGNIIGDKVSDINKALTAGVKYATNSTNLNKRAFETELDYLKDGVLREELRASFEKLESKEEKVTYLWDVYTKEQLANYKIENRQMYNFYKTMTGTTLTPSNINDFIIVVNLLVETTANTTKENVGDLKTAGAKINVSDFKTLIDDTVRTLEGLITHTEKSVTEANVTDYVTELVTLGVLTNNVILKHEDTLKYDLMKTLGAINKIEEMSKAKTKEEVSKIITDTFKTLTDGNRLNERIKYIMTVQRSKLDSSLTSSLDIDTITEDETISAKGYTSTARSDLYNPFKDIDNIYSKDEILELYNNGKIIGGTAHDTYSPSEKVTRAQFGVMIARATGASNEEGLGATDSKGRWFDNHLTGVVSDGIMTLGHVGSDGKFTEDKTSKNFHPNAGMQRKDMALYLVRILTNSGYDVTGLASKSNLKDIDDNLTLTEEEKNAVRVLESLDIIHGKEDGTYSPYEVANRAQVAKVLYKVFELTGHLG